MKFSFEYRIPDYDTDINGNVSVTSVMQYIQEAANLQHETYGPTIEELRGLGRAFVLSRCALDMLSVLRAHDTVNVETWLSEAKGYGFFRNTRIMRGSETVARMSAFWGVIDINTRHPLKAEDLELGFGSDDDTLTTDTPVRFRMPADPDMKLLGEHRVVYRECDENLHMNNAQYPGFFCDFIPDMKGKRVTGFSVNYRNEARLCTAFSIYGSQDGDRYYFRTVLEDGRKGSEAMIELGL